eukprot:Skav203904  [mRNA]  locus=scaffold1649:306602:313891:- [translate_table: standard]
MSGAHQGTPRQKRREQRQSRELTQFTEAEHRTALRKNLLAFAVLAAGCQQLEADGTSLQLAAALPPLPDQPLEVLSALTLAIICHEGGHFLCLRSIGLPAEEFAIGFGPQAGAIFDAVVNFGRKDGTEFVLRAFPIGGYAARTDATEFDARSAPERLWVLAGGVLANVAVAWSSLVVGVLNFGVPTTDPLPGIRIEAADQSSGAVDEAAFTRTGLQAKDVLLQIGLSWAGAINERR